MRRHMRTDLRGATAQPPPGVVAEMEVARDPRVYRYRNQIDACWLRSQSAGSVSGVNGKV
jgi:hypothetical protein